MYKISFVDLYKYSPDLTLNNPDLIALNALTDLAVSGEHPVCYNCGEFPAFNVSQLPNLIEHLENLGLKQSVKYCSYLFDKEYIIFRTAVFEKTITINNQVCIVKLILTTNKQPEKNQFGYKILESWEFPDASQIGTISYLGQIAWSFKSHSEELLKEVHNLAKNILKGVSKLSHVTEIKNKVYLLNFEYNDLTLTPYEITPLKVNLNYHYNDDFKVFHKKLIKHLNSTPINNALTFLYGKPGTGKTNYIRYLTTKVSKPVVYITKQTLNNLQTIQTSHATINLLSNSILILEDSEALLNDRQSQDQHPLTDLLLNLTDGILLGLLKSHIIVTFNTWPEHLDPALIRPGRLFDKYEFKDLTLEKTVQLLKHIKADPNFINTVNQGLTLAEIYNWSINKNNLDISKPYKPVGFSV